MDRNQLIAGRDLLRARIDERADEYLQWLIDFARIPSISATGEGIAEGVEHLERRLESVGLSPYRVDTGGHPMIRATFGTGARTILFYGHYDVVPPGEISLWPHPPFEPTLVDGVLWGRGVGDNKGQLLAHLGAVAAWNDVFGEPPPFQIGFVFDGEDEIGCPDTSKYVAGHCDEFRAEALFVSDASTLGVWNPAFFLGMRGSLYIELCAPGPSIEWHAASYGSILPNPATRIARAVASMYANDGRIAIGGFYDGVIPPAKAVDAYARALPADFLPPASHFGIRDFERSEPLLSMFFEPRLCVCGIDGGYTGDGVKLAVPTSARAKLDFSLQPGQHPDAIATLVRKHLDSHGFEDLEIHVLASCRPSGIAHDHPFVDTVSDALQDVWGITPTPIPSIGGGGIFATFAEDVGVPCIMVPYAQPDLYEHSAREHFNVSWFVNGVKTSAELFRRLSLDTLANERSS